MSQVIYARVPASLKEAADSYAASRGVTLTAAVADLLERGLEAATDERSVHSLQLELADSRAESAELRSRLAQIGSDARLLETLRERSAQVVGVCPNSECRAEISMYGLLVVGRCPRCDRSLSDLLPSAAPTTGLDQRELLMILGAIGAVLGVAWLANRTT